MKKKAIFLAAALAGLAPAVKAQEPVEPVEPANSGEKVSASVIEVSELEKTKIIESLKAIKKDPSTVKFHSAMCYDMVAPPPDTSFACPYCGEPTSYPSESFAGKVADWQASINRFLNLSRVKIDVDFSDFCSKCDKEKESPARLKFTSHCLDCSATFAWEINNEEELEQLSLLSLSFPITEVDQGHLGSQKISPEKLSEYISHRMFCPKCLSRNGLE
ncbi:MAG: hypothetical protein ACOYXC_12195 [Candidatus Rifleibacteriota bacterium]